MLMVETSHHLYLGCSFFSSFWHLVQEWFGVHSADPSWTVDHFTAGSLLGYTKSKRLFILLFYFTTSWVIWKERSSCSAFGED